MIKPFKQRDLPGQSLQEYLLPLALVVCLGVASLSLLGGQLSTMLGGTIQSDSFGSLIGGGRYNSNTRALMSQIETQTLDLTLSNGKTLRVNGIPANYAKAVETIGTDGTTKILAANLDSLAYQLRKEGELTEEQANLLAELSNQGYRYADIESRVEMLARRTTTKEAFRAAKIPFENEELTAAELAAKLNIESTGVKTQNRPVPPQMNQLLEELGVGQNMRGVVGYQNFVMGEEMYQLFSKYQAAEQKGALKNPLVTQVVKSLMFDISQLGLDFSYTTNRIHFHANEAGADLSHFTPDKLHERLASEITHMDATDICTTGGGPSNGQGHCKLTRN
jgi:hypothetical protein